MIACLYRPIVESFQRFEDRRWLFSYSFKYKPFEGNACGILFSGFTIKSFKVMKRCIEWNVYAVIMCFTVFIGIQMAESWRGDSRGIIYSVDRRILSHANRTIRAHILSSIPPAYYFLLSKSSKNPSFAGWHNKNHGGHLIRTSSPSGCTDLKN